MKGIILNLVEETIVAEHGEATWDALPDAADVNGACTSLGSYPDTDLAALVKAPYGSSRAFLLTLNEVIHPEVRTLHPDSAPPDFWFAQEGDTLVIHYRSRRRLCALAEGMIAGTGTHFGETVELTQDECMLSGADHCTLRATFGAV